MKLQNITTFVEMITPDVANQMLSRNTSNRPIRKGRVKELASAILRGEWKLSPQGISFDEQGNLIDGQHRLSAIVYADKACLMQVSSGWDRSVFDVLDVGLKRTIGDVLNLGRIEAQCLRVAAKVSFGGEPTPQQIEPFLNTALHGVILRIPKFRIRNVSSAPMQLALAANVSASPRSEQYLFGQYRALCTADFDSMDSTSKAYMKHTMQHRLTFDQLICSAIGMKVFDEKRRDLKVLRFTASEQNEAINKLRHILAAFYDTDSREAM